ncbi:hypothetical protein D8Y22_13345 [Salinadaptatus halalkaliphilus]|uniref:Uncharacterized protein n=1 Tax=Salinadaptatus halalkaliphilus TaxID=2419781 RepID=A0A4S3TJZ7_9EURY|nr:hypothetical protein D8Y22_13345 [Salinadaptatus halalkaliphilus]
MSADPIPVDAILEAAADGGIEFDGLRITAADDEYSLETPDLHRTAPSESVLRDILETIPASVTNWHYWQERVGGDGTARRAFLRWCERAPIAGGDDGLEHVSIDDPLTVSQRYAGLQEGIDREWGQLAITTRFRDLDDADTDGERVYDCWHVADADADVADLEVFDDPRDARAIATEDADGRYRPLKTAPTLASGWAFTGLSGDELVETVGFFYPATIANWHRELHGDLDISHWRETAARQTGIYDILEELPREALEWVAEACCVDTECLCRREWHYDEDDELAVDGGDGPFPCREPCSLVVAAARQWTILESERERTYELEVTPSELNQLSAIVDAVAEDRTDKIREADVGDGANRYRARYLRAKRFGADGLKAVERTNE